jgi:hypothetical protein
MRRAIALFLPLLAALAAGCPKTSTAPTITKFQATPASIKAGETSTLSWSVSDATQVSLDQGFGVQAGNSVDVTPAVTTTYTLSVTGPGGTTTAQLTVTVQVAKPVITSFTASPDDVPFGGVSTLSWTVTGTVTGLSLSNGINAQDVTGTTSKQLTVDTDTTFTLTATNSGGSVDAQATVHTHSAFLHLQYTDPTLTTAKLKLVKNAASIANRLVLDVKVGALPVTAFGFAMNLPLLAESSGMVALDTNLTPAGLIPNAGVINVGSSPTTGAVVLGGSAMPDVLSVGVAQHKASASDGDDTWAAGATLFSIAIKMTASAAAGKSVFLGSSAEFAGDPKFRAAALKKDGSEAVGRADVAVGDFIISN